jgi:hypothetical protein
MNENTIKKYAEIPDGTPCDRKERIERMKRIYKQTLTTVCPSKDIRAFAKRISKREASCDKCAYFGGNFCKVPFSDALIEDIGIDPCYLGVLMFLREEMGDSTDCAATLKLRYELDEVNEALIAVCEAVISSVNVLPHFRVCKPDMQDLIILIAENMRDSTQEILNDALARKERSAADGDNETEANTL